MSTTATQGEFDPAERADAATGPWSVFVAGTLWRLVTSLFRGGGMTARWDGLSWSSLGPGLRVDNLFGGSGALALQKCLDPFLNGLGSLN